MHGSSFEGDCAAALNDLAAVYEMSADLRDIECCVA